MPGSANSICPIPIATSTDNSRNISMPVLHFKWVNYYLPQKRWKVKEQLALLKSLGPLAHQELLSKFNSSFSLAHCPQIWRVATIIPLLKVGKYPSEVASFHPISLTSCVIKLLECILFDYLYYIAETNNLFSWFQASFRKGRSCEDQITGIVQAIKDGFKTTADEMLRIDTFWFQQSIQYGLEKKTTALHARHWHFFYIHLLDPIFLQWQQGMCLTLRF